jgi:hypothetical protein
MKCKNCQVNEVDDSEICWTCTKGFYATIQDLVLNFADAEDVKRVIENPYFPCRGAYTAFIALAATNNNLPALRVFLNDPRIIYSDLCTEYCIVNNFTVVVIELLSHSRAKGPHCPPGVNCVHWHCKNLHKWLMTASLRENAELVEFFTSTMKVPTKYIADIPAGPEPSGVMHCIYCHAPTETFEAARMLPECGDCVQAPEKHCPFCEMRMNRGDGQCEDHLDVKPLAWNSEEKSFMEVSETKPIKNIPARCFAKNCSNNDLHWVEYGGVHGTYILMCGSCHASKRFCGACHNFLDPVMGEYHTCKKTYTLRDGFFYLNAN